MTYMRNMFHFLLHYNLSTTIKVTDGTAESKGNGKSKERKQRVNCVLENVRVMKTIGESYRHGPQSGDDVCLFDTENMNRRKWQNVGIKKNSLIHIIFTKFVMLKTNK